MYVITDDKQLIDKAIDNCYLSGYCKISTDLYCTVCQIITTKDGGLYATEIVQAENSPTEYVICPLSKNKIKTVFKHDSHFRYILSRLNIRGVDNL